MKYNAPLASVSSVKPRAGVPMPRAFTVPKPAVAAWLVPPKTRPPGAEERVSRVCAFNCLGSIGKTRTRMMRAV